MNMNIGIDIDGTIKQTQKAAVEVFNRHLNQNVKVEDLREFYLENVYGLTVEEGRKWWTRLEAEIYTLGVPLDNAAEALNEMKKEGHRIYFITARPDTPELFEITKKWLKDYGFPFDGTNLHMGSMDKGKVARSLEVTLFFEDAPEHLERLIQAGIRTVIVDAVYNREVESLARIHNWEEGLELVRKLADTSVH
jgi:uncharacterized HAD superfamily protein